MDLKISFPPGVEIKGVVSAEYAEILTPEAVAFVAKLFRAFGERREQLLELRKVRQTEFDRGIRPDFLKETEAIRNGDWTIAPLPKDLLDRRVEITGPVDRKMVINALNSGASMYMADFEDSSTPTWANLIEGHINLRDAIRGTISFATPEGKSYRLNEKTAVLLVRPRGWHLPEKHMVVDGKPVSGSMFDFGMYFFHNVNALVAKGSAPYFYLPKIESHLEARLWNDIFVTAQQELGVPQGTIKATVLIETILAAFEMDEILYELRQHSAGLNCGRWDYLFSCIKKFRSDKNIVLADRNHLTMISPFMRSYALLLVKTCHRRNAPAMGGMAAQIPIKNDAAANDAAIAKVRADKERESTDGYDGTWVAHPALVPVAKEIFDKNMPTPNQIHRQRPDISISAKDLIDFKPEAPITEIGLRQNISIGLQYLGAWLGGTGCVPIFNLMEDAATAEISRAQLWQWIRSPRGVLDDGRKVTKELFRQWLPEELAKIKTSLGEKGWNAGKYDDAAKMFDTLTTSDDFVEFLTLPAYDAIA